MCRDKWRQLHFGPPLRPLREFPVSNSPLGGRKRKAAAASWDEEEEWPVEAILDKRIATAQDASSNENEVQTEKVKSGELTIQAIAELKSSISSKWGGSITFMQRYTS